MTTIALLPTTPEPIAHAIEEGGATITNDAADADALVWTNPFDPQGLRDVLASSPASWVQLPLAGIEEFVAAGVIDPARTWTCAKGIYGYQCAEHTLAVMLASARLLHRHVGARTWEPAGVESRHRMLRGLTVLLVGAGGIARELTAMLQPLGLRIVAVNRSGAPFQGADRTEPVSELPSLIGEADYVVLSAALTPETRGLFDAEMLKRMKPDAWLVNIGRGALVDTDALVDALRRGAIGGAALDVTDPEPLPDGHPLWDMDDVIITPHSSNTIEMSLPAYADLVRRNVAAFVRGEPLSGLVDPALGY